MRFTKWLSATVLLSFAAGIAFVAAGSLFMHETNRQEFCVSCHSMNVVNEEYQQSIHYKNASGIQATCADCHVPQEFGPLLKAKILAAKDVYHEIAGTINTREKFEARRWHLANLVWDKMEATDSRECRTCHEFTAMDYEAQGRKVARRHQRAEETGKTCIACHKGVAHVEPLPPIAAL
jgi:cytochrome c-type protein NapC